MTGNFIEPIDRRRLLEGALAGAVASALPLARARAQDGDILPLTGDDGRPVTNYRVPPEVSVDGLPGIVWTGAENPDVTLIEFFDYNCPFCRRTAIDLDSILDRDKDFRLGLVNNPILSPGSIQAAKVQQAVLKLYGPRVAYGLHLKMFGQRRPQQGSTALEAARAMGLDIAKIEPAGDGDDVGSVLKRHRELAQNLGFDATPSFILNNVGILGYPGRGAVLRFIAAVRSCDRLICK